MWFIGAVVCFNECKKITINKNIKRKGEIMNDVNMFTALKKYADFSGRARRKEYWLWQLFNIIVNVAFQIISMILVGVGVASGSEEFANICGIFSALVNLASGVVGLVLLIPNLSVAVRRLHDTGRSGWNLLWGLVPCVGPIILLVFYCQDSQPGLNQYGENPKEQTYYY